MSQQWPNATNFSYFGCQLAQALVTSLHSILHYITLHSRKFRIIYRF